MNDYFVLPFDDNPLITLFNNTGFLTGIIQGHNGGEIAPLAFGRYINCRFDNNDYWKFSFCLDGLWKTHSDLVHFCENTLEGIPLNKLIKSMCDRICDGYYITGLFNEAKIPGKEAYPDTDHLHDFLLIGFDNTKQEFISLGRLVDGNMHRFNIKYEDMLKALDHEGVWYTLITYEMRKPIILEIDKIKQNIYNYLHSVGEEKDECCYGVNAIEKVCSYTISSFEEKGYVDMRYIRGIMEHKKIMYQMVKYLSENGYIEDARIVENSKKVFDYAQTLHLLCLKMVLKNDSSILLIIEKRFDDILGVEKRYLPMLLSELK